MDADLEIAENKKSKHFRRAFGVLVGTYVLFAALIVLDLALVKSEEPIPGWLLLAQIGFVSAMTIVRLLLIKFKVIITLERIADPA